MVAYSFKERFVKRIEVGLSGVSLSFDPPPKRQTVRINGKRKHANTGDILQLYYAQRTKQCRLLGVARCGFNSPIIIYPKDMAIILGGVVQTARQIRRFVVDDGFDDVDDMRTFWLKEHPDVEKFVGTVIYWDARQ